MTALLLVVFEFAVWLSLRFRNENHNGYPTHPTHTQNYCKQVITAGTTHQAERVILVTDEDSHNTSSNIFTACNTPIDFYIPCYSWAAHLF
jgi:hypothetical protein